VKASSIAVASGMVMVDGAANWLAGLPRNVSGGMA